MELNDDFTDHEIKKRVDALDKSWPAQLPHPDRLWKRMLIKRKHKQSLRVRKAWGIAASIMVIIMAVSIWRMLYTDTGKGPEGRKEETVSIQEKEAIEYVNRLCRGNNISCTSPAFKELQEELKESSSMLREVDRQIAIFGNDIKLLQAKTRIENHQARIIKAMVQIL